MGIWAHRVECWGKHKCESQKGWKRDCGTHHAQRVVQNCIHTAKVEGRQLHLAFVDMRAAFDSVNHGILARAMHALGFAEADIKLAAASLGNQSHRVRTAAGLTEPVRVTDAGVPQGACESPCLFAIMLEPLLRELETSYAAKYGFKIGRTSICVQAFADDMVLISESKVGLQEMLDVVGDYCQASGLRVQMGTPETNDKKDAWMDQPPYQKRHDASE